MRHVGLYVGETLGSYGFPHGHPFGPDRLAAFQRELERRGLHQHESARLLEPVVAERELLERFHQPGYIDRVKALSEAGSGLLDMGDTPAFPGCYEAGASVVGTVLDGLERIMAGELDAAFIPIAGLHHARREMAGGFCIFNDCSIAIETLRSRHGLERVGYVDIDAHHGDGVYYGFADDPAVVIADLHEDGRFLYPGTGSADETGTGPGEGTKLNIPLLPGADDDAFRDAWARVLPFLDQQRPQFFLMQCGADSVEGDPITHMAFSPEAHRRATRDIRRLAETHAGGRLLATGGGGYNRENIATVWCAVVEELLRGTGTPV